MSAERRTRVARHWTSSLVLFGVALGVRLAFLALWRSDLEATGKSAWEWGYEAASIARALAEGQGFAEPWTRDVAPWSAGSGPTGWLPPAYPLLLAALMKLFGGVSAATACALFLVQSALSAATCVLIATLGRAIGEPRAGRLAGWVFCFAPAAVWNAGHTVWDTTLVAFAVTLFLWVFARYASVPAPRRGFALGLLFGALMLVNPAPVSLAPIVAACWFSTRAPDADRSQRVATCVAFALGAFLVALPWLVRNERTLGAFALRTNLGVEAMVGNNDSATGYFQAHLHPSYNPELFERYRELGEVEYGRWALGQAVDWVRANPARFVELSLHRVQLFWFGQRLDADPRREGDLTPVHDPKSWIKGVQTLVLGVLALGGAFVVLRRRRIGYALAAILVLFPVPYYLTHFLERYRFPIEPVIVLLVAVLLVDLHERSRPSRGRSASPARLDRDAARG